MHRHSNHSEALEPPSNPIGRRSPSPNPHFRSPSPVNIYTSATGSHQRISLTSSLEDQSRDEQLSNFYSIILTIEKLEVAYIDGSCSSAEYTEKCDELLNRYRTALASLLRIPNFSGMQTNRFLNQFMQKFHLRCPHFNTRIEAGMPATTQHSSILNVPSYSSAAGDSAQQQQQQQQNPASTSSDIFGLVADTQALFINLQNELALNRLSVEILYPQLRSLLRNINQLIGNRALVDGPSEFLECKRLLAERLRQLFGMGPTESLSEHDARRFAFELSNATDSFRNSFRR